jgi:hypothetical protein
VGEQERATVCGLLGLVRPHGIALYAGRVSVSLYYRARRTAPPSEAEAAAVERIEAAHQESFPYEDEESLYLYEDLYEDLYEGGGSEPGEILAGSTKLPLEEDRMMPVIAHVLDSLTELRRALPGADWRVHIDDLDIPWDEDDGYVLPGGGL